MIRRDVLGAQNLPDIAMFNFPAKSARIGAASSGAIAIISSFLIVVRRENRWVMASTRVTIWNRRTSHLFVELLHSCVLGHFSLQESRLLSAPIHRAFGEAVKSAAMKDSGMLN